MRATMATIPRAAPTTVARLVIFTLYVGCSSSAKMKNKQIETAGQNDKILPRA